MTRLGGASAASSSDIPRTSLSSERLHSCRSKLPQNAPDVINHNTIEVTDPSRVLTWHRDDRRRQFNFLVRSYKNQLLYGCQDPECPTPTCASYRRRTTEGPYRRYTDLSARTLACYLAGLDNAESGLCRNFPNAPSGFSSPDRRRRPRRQCHEQNSVEAPNTRHGSFQSVSESTPTDKIPLERGPEASDLAENPENNSAPTHVHAENENSPNHNCLPARGIKDPKSFTQNLFDTLSLRMVEWLPLRRSPDTSETDASHRSSSRGATQSPRPERLQTENHLSTTKPNLTHGRATAPHVQVPGKGTPHRAISSQPAAVELKLPNQHVKRLSLTEFDTWLHNPRLSLGEKTRPERRLSRTVSTNTHSDTNEFINMPSPPPTLKHHGPHKNRGKALDANSASSRNKPRKERRVSWDGLKVLNDPQGSETQRPCQISQVQPAADGLPPDDSKLKQKGKRRQHDSLPTAQTVTHLTSDIIDGLGQMMVQSEEEARTWKEELARMELVGSLDNSQWQFATPRQQQVFEFVAQTAFYALSSTKQILRSFRKDSTASGEGKPRSLNTRLDLQRLQPSFRRLFEFCPRDIALHSLWDALERLFVPPKDVSPAIKQSRRSSRNSSSALPVQIPLLPRQESEVSTDEHLSDSNAAYVATVALFALVSTIPEVDTQTWRGILQTRSAGTLSPDADMRKLSSDSTQSIIRVTDGLEHELSLRLVSRFVRALTARLTFNEISKTRRIYTHDSPKQRPNSALDFILDNLSEYQTVAAAQTGCYDNVPPLSEHPGPSAVIVEWLRTLFLKEWDGNPEMARSSAAGGAVQILASMYRERNRLGLIPEDFHTPFLSERLDPMDMPVDWLNSQSNNKTMHLLSYSFIFPPSALVIYFRALNYSVMSKYYEAAMTTIRHVTQTAFSGIHVNDDVGLLARMRTSMSAYLVLVVSRDRILTDALNQLWRRERRELMRPLKVQMGMDEGEEGVDHGGVQQEFFRVAMAEALNPCYGMFTTDSRTRASWFQPCALEPLYKFELLGLLMSLAVYNGLTLPVSFPIALYRKLLGLKVRHLDHIRDGWPELVSGLDELLKWKDGDVGDVFMRTYEFSFEAFGVVKTADMQKIDRDAVWPLPSEPVQSRGWNIPFASTQTPPIPPSYSANGTSGGSPVEGENWKKNAEGASPFQLPTPAAKEAPLVTNQNRHQFVKDYIFWLTDKSVRAQYEALARGFYTCLDRSALSVFTPEALKSVVEGSQEIDVDELERHARYEGGFSPTHRSIREFWSIAKRFSSEKKAQLLEFVTASDRVPVNGIASIMFVIQRNGVDDTRLPTSLTCFGRLLLPEYSSEGVLEEKLNKALENSRGFGVA